MGAGVCRVLENFQGKVMRHAAEKHQSRQLASSLRSALGGMGRVGQRGREA